MYMCANDVHVIYSRDGEQGGGSGREETGTREKERGVTERESRTAGQRGAGETEGRTTSQRSCSAAEERREKTS